MKVIADSVHLPIKSNNMPQLIWNKYPENKPTETTGLHLITIQNDVDGDTWVELDFWVGRKFRCEGEDDNITVLAFMDTIEPYKP